MIAALLLVLCLAFPAAADTLPALYRVTGVAADDVLNIRAAPDAAASQIGQLQPGSTGVEVVALSRDGRWGQVNTWEWAGWVAMRYLEREPGPDWTAMQSPMRCHGTEPFWSMRVDAPARRLTIEPMEGPPQPLRIEAAIPVSGRDGVLGWRIAGPEGPGFATIQAQACSDGMSDRLLGLSITLFPFGGPGLSGCCTLQP